MHSVLYMDHVRLTTWRAEAMRMAKVKSAVVSARTMPGVCLCGKTCLRTERYQDLDQDRCSCMPARIKTKNQCRKYPSGSPRDSTASVLINSYPAP